MILINVVVTYRIRSFDVRSFNNWPTKKLTINIKTIVLNTNILPNKVVKITVITAANPKDSLDLCHSTMPGIVANKHNTKPSGGNICKTKATMMSEIILKIVALGSIFENKFCHSHTF